VTTVELDAVVDGLASDREAQFVRATASFGGRMRRLAGDAAFPYALACVAAATVALVVSGPVVWPAVAVVVIALSLELATAEAYERNRTLRPVKRLIAVTGGGLLVMSSFAWLTPAEVRDASAVVMAAALTVVGAVVHAAVTRRHRSVLLVGGRVGVGQCIMQWASSPAIELKGVCLPEFVGAEAEAIMDVPVLGSLEDVAGVAIGLGVDEVVVAPGPVLSGYDVRRLSWALEHSSIELSVAADVDGAVPHRIRPRVLGQRLMLSVRPGRRSRPALWAKGAIDRVAASGLLLILSPVLLVISIAIRRDSPGPVFFRQTRAGLDGAHFTMYKLRTMVVDAEARLAELKSENQGAGPLFKMRDDPRITRIGAFLRCTSLDELPQLLNVIKGEMSLVGPRPGLPSETAAYDEWIHRRLRVKPGMTGAWQVGGRSNLSWTDSVRLDIDYVDNSTLLDDLRIAVRTARVVIARDGAV
jgi:exopolysaccharide biosynthesis polyprenyl glycosylphosphotransferase